VLASGGIVLHATEGVWGFAADPTLLPAVDRILELKGRSANKGFILIAGSADVFTTQLATLSRSHRAQILSSWPGAHTWVLPDDEFSPIIRGYRDTVACRVPGHGQARALCQLYNAALVSTSANLAGQPAVTTAAAAFDLFGDRVDFFLPGEVKNPGQASTIYGLDGQILR